MIKSFNINGTLYTLTASTYSSRDSRGHKASLMIDGEIVYRKKIRYYNRTWERYQYQTVLLLLIEGAMDILPSRAFNDLVFIYKHLQNLYNCGNR